MVACCELPVRRWGRKSANKPKQPKEEEAKTVSKQWFHPDVLYVMCVCFCIFVCLGEILSCTMTSIYFYILLGKKNNGWTFPSKMQCSRYIKDNGKAPKCFNIVLKCSAGVTVSEKPPNTQFIIIWCRKNVKFSHLRSWNLQTLDN